MLDPHDIALADLLENTDDAVLLVDLQGVVRAWNRGAVVLLGWSSAEVVGRDCGFFVPRDLSHDREADRDRTQAEDAAHPGSYRTRRLHASGRELVVSLTRTALQDRAGQPVGWVEFLRDSSVEDVTDERTRRSRQMSVLSKWAAVIAHQVKNPLAGIYAAIQILARSMEPEDPRSEVLAEVVREIRRLDQTTRDLLTLALQRPVQLVRTDLQGFVIDLATSLQSLPEIVGHPIELHCMREVLTEIDPTLLAQALQIIVLNAAQAMGDRPGGVRLSLGDEDDRIVIGIDDDGPGIAPKVLPCIFEPFFTTKTRGSGLGLSVARRNVESMGGTIDVTTELGRGTCFRLSFPRTAQHTIAPPRSGIAGSPARGRSSGE